MELTKALRPPDISYNMATVDVLPQPAMPEAQFGLIIENQARKRKLDNIEFDPKEHLAFEEPENIIMMKDIGYSKDTGISPVAVSQPFRLFSTDAVQKFRDEVLCDQVLANCLYKSNLAACQVRGYAPK